MPDLDDQINQAHADLERGRKIKSEEENWLYDPVEISFLQAKKQEERKDKELDRKLDRQDENDKFIRDLIKEGLGIATSLVLIAAAVLLSRADSKDEAAIVAGIAGTFGGSFTVLTKNSMSKKNESDN